MSPENPSERKTIYAPNVFSHNNLRFDVFSLKNIMPILLLHARLRNGPGRDSERNCKSNELSAQQPSGIGF